jgi:hypothetical protein
MTPAPKCRWLRVQFGTSSLLSATTFIGICLGGAIPFFRAFSGRWDGVWSVLGVLSPIFVPFLFVAYALGRRTLSTKIVFAFAISEAAAVGALLAITGGSTHWPL